MSDSKPEKRMQSEKSPNHKETHGLRNDIDETTPLDEVKAPNVFERAKEEIEAIVQSIHHPKDSSTHQTIREESKNGRSKQNTNSGSDSEAKTPKFIEKAKERVDKMIHHEKSSPSHRHHKETHGRSNDIDETTPIEEVKAPGFFERAKEEIEAVFQAIHPRKDR